MRLSNFLAINFRVLIALPVLVIANFFTESQLIAAEPNNFGLYRGSPAFGGPTTRTTQATGYGASENEAISDAIKNAVLQETGARISDDAGARGAVKSYIVVSAAQVENLLAGTRSETTIVGSASGSLRAEDNASTNSAQDGLISGDSNQTNTQESLSIDGQSDVNVASTSSSQLVSYHWQATIEAEVFVFEASNEGMKPKLVIAPAEANSRSYNIGDTQIDSSLILNEIHTQITNILSQTGRFDVLQRGSSVEIQAEIDFINSSLARSQESSRLGQQYSADIILATRIDDFEYRKIVREMRTTDRQIVSYEGNARVSTRLLNPTTGTLVTSQSFVIEFPGVAETTMPPTINPEAIVADAVSDLAEKISEHLIRKLFPISVISLASNEVVLSQGGKALESGTEYEAVILGEELIDPQTGNKLGRSESMCCTIRIDQVSELTSTGQIVGELSPRLQSFVPGMIELRDKISRNEESRGSQSSGDDNRQPASVTIPAPTSNQGKPEAPSPPDSDPDW